MFLPCEFLFGDIRETRRKVNHVHEDLRRQLEKIISTQREKKYFFRINLCIISRRRQKSIVFFFEIKSARDRSLFTVRVIRNKLQVDLMFVFLKWNLVCCRRSRRMNWIFRRDILTSLYSYMFHVWRSILIWVSNILDYRNFLISSLLVSFYEDFIRRQNRINHLLFDNRKIFSIEDNLYIVNFFPMDKEILRRCQSIRS